MGRMGLSIDFDCTVHFIKERTENESRQQTITDDIKW